MTLAEKYKQFTIEQLKALSDEIWEEIRARDKVAKAVAIRNFDAGMKVFFVNKGIRTNCTVEKVLRSNIDVITDAGKRWRVPANILQKVAA